MPGGQPRADRYSHTPRKVFDKAIDRMVLKVRREHDDRMADIHLLLNRIKQLQLQLDELQDHVNSHCQVIAPPDEDPVHEQDDIEEL